MTNQSIDSLSKMVWEHQLAEWRERADRKVWAEAHVNGWSVLYEHFFDMDRGGAWWGSEVALEDLDAEDAATLVELIIDGREGFVHNLTTV